MDTIKRYIKGSGLSMSLVNDPKLLVSKAKERIKEHEERIKIIRSDMDRASKDIREQIRKRPALRLFPIRFLYYDPIVSGNEQVLAESAKTLNKLLREREKLKKIIGILK